MYGLSLLRQLSRRRWQTHLAVLMIVAHMGSLDSGLQRLGETLDKYPNFYVEFSARLNVLGRLNPVALHDFSRNIATA